MSKDKPVKRFSRKDQEHGVPWKGYGDGNSPMRPGSEPWKKQLNLSAWLKRENKGIPKKTGRKG